MLDDQRSLGENEALYVTQDNQVISDVTSISRHNSSSLDGGLNHSRSVIAESSHRARGVNGSHSSATHPHQADPNTKNSDTMNRAGADTPSFSAGPSQTPRPETNPVLRHFENLPGPNTTQPQQIGTPPLYDWLTQVKKTTL